MGVPETYSLKPSDLPVPFDRYVLESILGEGGMAKVFRAELRGLAGFRKTVALKLIKAHLASGVNDHQRSLFLREARLGGLLRHPNLVDVYELGEINGEWFLSMEWVDGLTLKEAVAMTGALPASVMFTIAKGLAWGLEEAHALTIKNQRAGLVHRDLKPSNVLIGWTGAVKIADFGIAQLAARASKKAGLNRSAGSPGYMSPEQWTGDPVDHRSDIFSLGCIFFEMALGRRLFEIDPKRSLRVAALQVETRFEETSELETLEDLAPGLGRLIHQCLRLDPYDRYSCARDVAVGLEDIEAQIPRKPSIPDWMETLRETETKTGDSGNTTLDLSDQEFLFESRSMAANTFTDITNLPPEPNLFIGRVDELAALETCLKSQQRLITVVGPPGTGKTRLVKRFCMSWQDASNCDSVWFCDLSEARNATQVLQCVAVALDLSLADHGTNDEALAERMGHAIAGRGRTVLILDNAEQVATEVGKWVQIWLQRAPHARFVVTSRVPLRLNAEQKIPLGPLPLPRPEDSQEAHKTNDAVALFVERATTAEPTFRLTAANTQDVVAIIRDLDGLPLAIELAAARVKMWPPNALRARLSDRFQLLTSAQTTGPNRQATLRAALDWSWDLLTPWEQSALAQCSVFHGGFDWDAAEAVVDVKDWTQAPWSIDVIAALIENSLIMVGDETGGERRLSLLVSVSEYAREKFEAMGPSEVAAAKRRHASVYAAFGSDAYRASLKEEGSVLRAAQLLADRQNIFIASRRAVTAQWVDEAVQTATAAILIYSRRGPTKQGVVLAEDVLALPLTPLQEAKMRLRLGHLLHNQGRLEESRSQHIRALAFARANKHRRLEGIALGHVAKAVQRQGRIDEALEHYENALVIHREERNTHAEGSLLGSMGVLFQDRGQMDKALKHLKLALAIQRKVGHRYEEGRLLGLMGNLHMGRGRMQRAQDCYLQALAIHREGDRLGEGHVLGNLGLLHQNQGRMDEALACYKETLSINREVGNRPGEGHALGHLGNLYQSQSRFKDALLCFRQAMKIHTESGNRLNAGIVLLHLGSLYADMKDIPKAKTHYLKAMSIHREMGNSGIVGSLHGHIGLLLAQTGDFKASRKHLTLGEALLRDLNDPLHLAELLVNRAKAEHLAARRRAARTAFSEAEKIAVELNLTETSEIVADLRALAESFG